MRLILASGSPRRKDILNLAGLDFTIMVSRADEDVSTEDPEEMVKELSRRKACETASRLCRSQGEDVELCLVLGSDTVVSCEGKILGKPEAPEDARAMLEMLSGRTHQVYTGVTLLAVREGRIQKAGTFAECTDVSMRRIEPEEMDEYIASGEPMDKAGAYGIQGKAAVFISGIQGDYYNVVGLPLCRTMSELKRFERELLTDGKE